MHIDQTQVYDHIPWHTQSYSKVCLYNIAHIYIRHLTLIQPVRFELWNALWYCSTRGHIIIINNISVLVTYLDVNPGVTPPPTFSEQDHSIKYVLYKENKYRTLLQEREKEKSTTFSTIKLSGKVNINSRPLLVINHSSYCVVPMQLIHWKK